MFNKCWILFSSKRISDLSNSLHIHGDSPGWPTFPLQCPTAVNRSFLGELWCYREKFSSFWPLSFCCCCWDGVLTQLLCCWDGRCVPPHPPLSSTCSESLSRLVLPSLWPSQVITLFVTLVCCQSVTLATSETLLIFRLELSLGFSHVHTVTITISTDGWPLSGLPPWSLRWTKLYSAGLGLTTGLGKYWHT